MQLDRSAERITRYRIGRRILEHTRRKSTAQTGIAAAAADRNIVPVKGSHVDLILRRTLRAPFVLQSDQWSKQLDEHRTVDTV